MSNEYFDDQTLFKVQMILERHVRYNHDKAREIILDCLNEGILFRERDKTEEASLTDRENTMRFVHFGDRTLTKEQKELTERERTRFIQFGDQTLYKVQKKLERYLSNPHAMDIISDLLRDGVVFSERSDTEDTADAPEPEDAEGEEESNLVKHARRELELINEDPHTTEGALKVVRAFAEMGHSGGSASVFIPMLTDLLNFKNLAPLTNDPDEWEFHPGSKYGTPVDLWQNRRNSEAFSQDGGQTYYLLSEISKDGLIHQTRRSDRPYSKPQFRTLRDDDPGE